MKRRKKKKSELPDEPKRLRGASRMRQQGYKQVVLWLDAAEFETVTDAARHVGKPVATFARSAAVSEAEMIGVRAVHEKNNFGR